MNAECETINVKEECVTVDVKEEYVEEDPLMEVSNSKTGKNITIINFFSFLKGFMENLQQCFSDSTLKAGCDILDSAKNLKVNYN